MNEWIVMGKSGTAYVELWRGAADDWFTAIESVDPSARMAEMFAVLLEHVRFVRMVDGVQGLPDADLIKTMPDGSLRRMRAQEEVIV